jgi:hypothetical protein
MGIPLSCQYCLNADQVQYYVTVEILNPGPFGWFEPPINDLLRKYQNAFNIRFEFIPSSSAGTGLCSVCFLKRFVGNMWKDYRQKFEIGDKICMLTINYRENGYFQSQSTSYNNIDAY